MIKKEIINVFDKISKEYKRLRKENDCVKRISKWKKYELALDEGCGPGTNFPAIIENVKFYIALDISLGMIRETKEEIKTAKWKVDLIVADATFLPFKDEVFDLLVAIAVFHHLPKDNLRIALGEVERVLNRSGITIFTFWNLKVIKESKILERKENLFYVAWKSLNKEILKRPYFNYTLKEISEIVREKFIFFDIFVSWNIVCFGMKE
ncbi:MAG: class I SAM-dependent methyltransferase [Thermoproteota archaeon]|nr:class I SAM-dependent methyltransferase [Candidatus Brockarchaeota archaeon]MBO3768781.1 class I SAM-dependent methyltransferase [Candidatus Brockarchaeota archaeon]MBO3801002.1 class I SAM-dependent methyltransferase [Candidatus Brockarchaeota archaeon]